MADTFFCLDIHRDRIAAVVVDRSASVSIVTGCGSADIVEQSFEAALDQIKEQTGYSGGRILVTFGAELFSFRNISLPFSDRKKIEQVLPFELEELSPIEMNSLLVDFIVAKTKPEGVDIVAGMISREYLAEHLSMLQAAGIDPDSIGISGLSTALRIADGIGENFILIDIGADWANLFIVREGQVALVRSFGLEPDSEGQALVGGAFVLRVKQTLLASQLLDMQNPDHSVYLTGSGLQPNTTLPALASSLGAIAGGVEINQYCQSEQPFIKIDSDINKFYLPELMDRVLASAIKGGKAGREFNFRKDEFKKRKSVQEYRHLLLKVVIPLALVLVSFIGYIGYEYSKLTVQNDQLRHQINEIFTETLPEVTRIVNPVQQLQVINNQIKATYSPGGGSDSVYTIIELLSELSARIPATYKVKFVRMVADMDGLRLKGVTGNFNTVDNVQKELGKSHYFKDVTISSANQAPRGDEVNFELKLDLVRQ